MSEQLEKGFKQFRLGLSLFFVGLVVIYIASQMLQPSLTQELVMAAAVVILVIGFVMAIIAEGRIVLARFWDFFFKKDSDSQPESDKNRDDDLKNQ